MDEDEMPDWEQLPPIRALPNAVYSHGDEEYYHMTLLHGSGDN